MAKSAGAKPVVKDLHLTPVSAATARLTVTVKAIPLRTIMDVTAKPGYGDLGLDTAITGPVTVEWGGPAANIADTVQIGANLQLAPTGVARVGVRNNVPVHGQILARYDGSRQVVNIERVTALTPATTLNVSGVLGVNKGDPLTALRADLQARDVGEFDQLLTTLDLESGGKKGSAAVPVVLHGTLGFNGTASGPILNLDVKGHLVADNLELKLGTVTDTLIDSVVADAEYSPSTGVAVASSTIKRQTAVLNLTGTLRPRRVVGKRGAVDYEWDQGMGIDANVKHGERRSDRPAGCRGAAKQGAGNGNGEYQRACFGDDREHERRRQRDADQWRGVWRGVPDDCRGCDCAGAADGVNASRVLVAAHGMQVTSNLAAATTLRASAFVRISRARISSFQS